MSDTVIGKMDYSVLGLLEYSSIAMGIKALDEMVKIAPIFVIDSKPVCAGKYITLIGGDEASVQDALDAGIKIASDVVIDSLFLSNLSTQIIPAITGSVDRPEKNAVGVIETFSVASAVLAADKVAKTSDVILVEIRLAVGLGGKSFLVFMGEIHNVEVSLNAGATLVKEKGLLVRDTIIQYPDEKIIPYLFN